MGVSKYDNEAGDRKYSARYAALDSAEGVRLLLSEYHALDQRRFAGDYDACAILIDLARAAEMAGLTGRQREALRLVYGEDLTQVEAGKRLGIAQKNVSELVDRALGAIAEVYFYWSGHGEGYSVGDSVNGGTNTKVEAAE